MEQQPRERIATRSGTWSYTEFVRGNPIGARMLETVLQYAGFFAPSRLAERDLAIESGYAAASLAALAHGRILTPMEGCSDYSDGADQSSNVGAVPGVRLDSKRRDKSPVENFAEQMRVAVAVFSHIQIVVEKLARQHGGERGRRYAITCLEALKAVSRLLLLACTREMVIGGGAYIPGKRRAPRRRNRSNKSVSWRQADLTQASSGPPSGAAAGRDSVASSPRPCSTPDIYTGKRSGVRFVLPPRASVVWSGSGARSTRANGAGKSASSYNGSCSQGRAGADGTCDACRGNSCGAGSEARPRALGAGGAEFREGTGDMGVAPDVGGQRWPRRSQPLEDGLDCDDEAGFSQAWLMTGEVVNILRPLVYSLRCGASQERSWSPWLTSLAMDAVAYACTTRAGGGDMALLLPLGRRPDVDQPGAPVLPYLDDEQAAELKRRKMLWFLYLMRSPAFEMLVGPVSRGTADVFEGVPLMGGMVQYALSMLLYVQRHHFYTSAS